MTVNRDQVKAMGDIMAKLNNFDISAATSAPSRGNKNPTRDDLISPPVAGLGVSSGQKKAMGDILKIFRTATEELRETAISYENDQLFEALQTEITPRGVRMAEWEVVITDHPEGLGKYYDVVRDDITIASDLRLYEAAKRLVDQLNKGVSITNPTVRKILELSARYSAKLEEAIQCARKAKNATGAQAGIIMARLDEAKIAARQARDALLKLP